MPSSMIVKQIVAIELQLVLAAPYLIILLLNVKIYHKFC